MNATRGQEPLPNERDQRVQLVNRSNLRRLNVRPSLIQYLHQLWDRHAFIVTDARFRAFRTTKSYKLWRFWLVAQPILDAGVYGLLFGVLLKTSRGIDNFLGFLFIGITFFSFMTALVNGGQSLLQTSKNMIQTFAFPRASLVFSQSIRYFLDNLLPIAVAVCVGLVAQWQKPVHWTVILTIPLTALIWMFGTGLMFFVARVTAFIPDMRVIINLGIRCWFFSSGIFFSLERYSSGTALFEIMSLNPGYIFLEAVRGVVLYGQVPSISKWITMSVWSLSTLLLGLIFFWQAEDRYAKVE